MKLKLDKKSFMVAGAGVAVVLCIWLFNSSLSVKRDLGNLKVQQKELLILKEECLILKNRIEGVEAKRSLAKAEGIVQASDEIFRSLGLRQKVKSVRSTGRKKIGNAFEEEADLQIEKVDMNEMVNIFHKIENAPMILSIKKATIRTSFEDPALLDIGIVLVLVMVD